MSDVLSFYFDGAIVQAVKACISNDTLTIKDARTFPFDEFDDYLSACGEKTCVVCSNPPLFYQDIVHLPPAAGKLYDKLVRSEIQKAHPDLTSFSIFHRTIGESIIDTRQYSKIAVFSYPDDFIADFILKVNRHCMAISSVYAAPCSIARLALSTCGTDPDQPRIFIASLPGEKLLLVCENGEMEFIRKIPSFDSALLPEDTNNINMTVDYCFQSLRIRPLEAVMLNQSELSEEFSASVSIPYRATLPLPLTDMPPHLVQEYLAPVATALHAATSPGFGNILPSDYAAFSVHKKLLTAAAMFMLVLTLLLGGYLVAEWLIISELKSKIARARMELSGSADELASFRKLDAEVKRLNQPLDFTTRHNTSLNPATALAALTLPASAGYSIKVLAIQSGEGFLGARIEGNINASGFSETQAIFEGIVEQLGNIPGYTVSSSSVDVKLKTFSIQARYKGIGTQVK